MPLIFIFFNKANLKHSHNLLVIDIDKNNNNNNKKQQSQHKILLNWVTIQKP